MTTSFSTTAGPSSSEGSGGGAVRGAVRRAPFTTAGLVLGAWVVDLAADPTSHHVPLCPFHVLTGLWCPLCGGLRAAWELGHGQLAAAARDNLLFVAALPILFVYWLDWISRARRGLPRRRVAPAPFAVIVAICVVFWVVRNVPGMEWIRPL